LGLPRTAPAQALNVDLSTISAATDVAFAFGAPLQEIVDLTFQSGPDARVPARLHLYNSASHLRYDVPVRSVLVRLRPKADVSDLSGKLAYVCGGKKVEFEYDVFRMWQQTVGPFLQGGLGVRMHESRAYDMAVEEGEIRRSHRVLLQQGRSPLGPPDPATESVLRSIQDLERLERMTEAILTAKSWQDLLSVA
jgi:hypothetical protein